mmetsp:Transcript_40709/g.91686  ORF Transcript_40709/g.91686 Transcript_40709/m.91686 type:complete len:460 (+) Transcript_40709:120-1499(+)
MAPKRTAGASRQAPKAKVARKAPVDPVEEAVERVMKGLRDCEGTEAQKTLLLETGPAAMRTLAEGRHPFVSQVFAWAQQLLTEHGNAVVAKEAKAKSVVAAVDERRGEAAKVKEAAAATVADCEAKLSAAKESRQQAQDELKARSAELKATLKEKSEAAAVEAKIQATIAEVEATRALVMTSDPQTTGFKKIVAKIVSQLKAAGGEEGLVACAASALEAKERTSFDWTAVNYITKQFDTYHTSKKQELADQQALIAKIDESLVPHKQAADKLTAAKEVESAAQEALRAGEKAVKDAKAAKGAVEADFMEAEVMCASCMEARAELDTVMTHFNFLLTRAVTPEVDPADAVAEVSVEAPAAPSLTHEPLKEAIVLEAGDVVQVDSAGSPTMHPVAMAQATNVASDQVAAVPVEVPTRQSPKAQTELITAQKSCYVPSLENQENVEVNVPLAEMLVSGVDHL